MSYLQKFYIRVKNDPEMFSQVINCAQSDLWFKTMKDEMNSMKNNGVLGPCKFV